MANFARTTLTTKAGRSQPKRVALRVLALGSLAGSSLLVAACGGGSSGAAVAQLRPPARTVRCPRIPRTRAIRWRTPPACARRA
jgi:hypothetical protein